MDDIIQIPVIGITTAGRNEAGRFHVSAAYVDAVREAGGAALLLPPVPVDPAVLLARVDGVILTGGGDIDPSTYGGEPHPLNYNVDPERDAFELQIAQYLLVSQTPVLGICRGCQVLNVTGGGNLVAHIPERYGTAVEHRSPGPEREPVDHPVVLMESSRLTDIFGEDRITVRSWHHQSIDRVAPDWVVVAKAEDGVVEAIEHTHHPWAIGVQWHPEMTAATDSYQQRLFRALVEAARRARVPREPAG